MLVLRLLTGPGCGCELRCWWYLWAMVMVLRTTCIAFLSTPRHTQSEKHGKLKVVRKVVVCKVAAVKAFDHAEISQKQRESICEIA